MKAREGKRRLVYQLVFPERFLSKTHKNVILPPLVGGNGTGRDVYLHVEAGVKVVQML